MITHSPNPSVTDGDTDTHIVTKTQCNTCHTDIHLVPSRMLASISSAYTYIFIMYTHLSSSVQYW